jgi:inorganic triphosphatase YgiF
MSTEIELKLAIASEHVPLLARSPTLRAAVRGRPVTRATHSTYFDTSDRALRRAGMALRLRRDGRRWIQTLKTAGRVEGGLHARDEFEMSCAHPQLDFTALIDTPLGDAIADTTLREALQPVFTTEFRRTARAIELAPGCFAELVLDRGEVIAGERRAPLCEVEIELVPRADTDDRAASGDVDALFAFAARLVREVPLRLSDVSKAQRGYALADAADAVVTGPVKAGSLALDRALPVPALFARLARHATDQLLANEAGLLDASPDVEYVHQARVALRRLRSVLRLFREVVPRDAVAALAERLRAVGNLLGETRDWDVFLGETLAAVEAAIPGEETLAGLHAQAASRRRSARDTTAAAITDPEWTVLMLDLARAIATQPWRATLSDEARALEALPAARFASRLLAKQAKRVRRLGREIAALDDTALHALRIEIKKLRYATEFFQSLYPRKAVRVWIDATVDLQALLGTLNDAAVTQRLLAELDGGDPDAARACGLVRGFTAARAQAGRAQIAAAWARFRAARPFW